MVKINKTGFLQALGIVTYCSAVASIMFNGNKIFGKADTFITPIAVLTMLSTSVLVCGLLVFYNPYLLFFKGKKKEAIETVFSTAVSLFGFLIIFFTIMFLMK
jgi:hypothetical protein